MILAICFVAPAVSGIRIKNNIRGMYTMSGQLLEWEKKASAILSLGSSGEYFIVSGRGPQELLARCMQMDPEDRPKDFTVVEEELCEIYKTETGADYLRPAPKAAADTADSLNNYAAPFRGNDQSGAVQMARRAVHGPGYGEDC